MAKLLVGSGIGKVKRERSSTHMFTVMDQKNMPVEGESSWEVRRLRRLEVGNGVLKGGVRKDGLLQRTHLLPDDYIVCM